MEHAAIAMQANIAGIFRNALRSINITQSLSAAPMPVESLAYEVRRKLDEGALPDDLVRELVSRGLSAGTARQFVDRALEECAATSAPAEEPLAAPRLVDEPASIAEYVAGPEAVATSRAYLDLTLGAIALTIGIAMTWLWFRYAGRATFFCCVILVGLFVFVRGIRRCRDLARPFPWAAVLANGAVPAALVCAVAYSGHLALQRQRQEEAAAAAELAAADRSRAAQIRQEAAEQREIADRERTARRDERLARALAQLSSNRPMQQCDAALEVGRLGSRENAPALVALLSPSTDDSVRVCAAGALVEMGETAPAMALYMEWIQGSNVELRRSALMGFGDVGPSAAAIALPYLTEELKSPDWSARYLAVESLAKLGPDAVSLLQVAAGDVDERVRGRAADALRAPSR